MNKIFGVMIAGLMLCVAGCNSKGTPVDYSKTCDKANDKKNVEVVGFFYNTGSAMCSKSGNEPMRCPVEFVGASGDKKGIRANIDKGSGKSEIDAVEGKGLQIHDETGGVIDNAQKVRIVARVRRLDGVGVDGCYIDVKKIEKAQ